MYRIRFKLFLILMLTAVVGACSLVPDELKTVGRLMETSPDSALHILQNLPPGKIQTDESRALYGLLMTEALNRNKKPFDPALLDFSVAYYEKNPDRNRLAACYFYKGRASKYALQNEKAMGFYLKALDVIADKNDYALMARIDFDLGDIYNLQNDFELARAKYRRAYSGFMSAGLQQPAFFAQLNIGRTYKAAQDHGRAARHYLSISRLAKDSLQTGALLQEMALNYSRQKRYDSALHYFHKVLNYPNIENNCAIRYYHLADLLFELNKIDSAYFYASSALVKRPDMITKRECYRILVNVANERGNIPELQKYMARYQDCSDSIRKIETQTKGSVIETIHAARQETAQTRSWLWYAVGLLVVVVIVSVVIYIAKHRKNKQEKQRAEEDHQEEKAVIRQKVVLDKRELLQQKIAERKEAMHAASKTANPREREQRIREIYDDLLHIGDQEFFFREMDVVLNNLISRIRSRYKSVNTKDLIWCCMYLLKIPTHDMLILLDYKSANSLKVLKNRLADKFGLESAALLGEFLLTLLAED